LVLLLLLLLLAATLSDCFWTLETDDADGSKYVSIVLVKGTMGYQSWDALLESDRPDTTVTHRVSIVAEVHTGCVDYHRADFAWVIWLQHAPTYSTS
jgi:hypothetical protein